jgi:hypothetical protein
VTKCQVDGESHDYSSDQDSSDDPAGYSAARAFHRFDRLHLGERDVSFQGRTILQLE